MSEEQQRIPRRVGRPVGSDGAATRAQLLRSAREVIGERGCAKATPALIARGAHVSRTAFYHYFQAREDLYTALVADLEEMVLDELFRAAEAAHDPRERVAEVFRASSRINREDPSYGRFLTTLLVEGDRDPELQGHSRETVERFRRLFAEAIESAVGLERSEAVEALVDLFVALQWGLGVFAAFLGDAERLDAVVDVVIARVLPELLPGPPRI